MTLLAESTLPLPLWRKGKVREVYEVGTDRLLLVTSDRVSAFDVIMSESVPRKGAVLTRLSAFWFRQLAPLGPSHFITADTDDIVAAVPALAAHRDQFQGRATLVRRTSPILFECVVRGFLAGSDWAEYRDHGTLAGERLPTGLVECAPLPAPLFSPATKAESGHDENVPVSAVEAALGSALTSRLRERSLALYQAGRDHAAARGIIIADTKFEFGLAPDGDLLLIDEVLTPESSRFWPADQYAPGRSQPSFDKQPLRDHLAGLRAEGRWNGHAPAPALPHEVIAATSRRYLEAYRRLTGRELEET